VICKAVMMSITSLPSAGHMHLRCGQFRGTK